MRDNVFFSDMAVLWENINSPNTDPDAQHVYNTRHHIRQKFWEAALLWKYSKLCIGNIVEIGRCRGGTTALMLEATAGTDKIVTSIDRVSVETDICLEIFEKHKDRYVSILSDSQKATIDQEYGLLFIDGNHKYNYVKADTERYWNNLITGGYVFYHDYYSPRWGPDHVKKFVDEWIEQGRAKKLETRDISLVLEKIK